MRLLEWVRGDRTKEECDHEWVEKFMHVIGSQTQYLSNSSEVDVLEWGVHTAPMKVCKKCSDFEVTGEWEYNGVAKIDITPHEE